MSATHTGVSELTVRPDQGDVMQSFLQQMSTVFLPMCNANGTWPSSIKKVAASSDCSWLIASPFRN